MWFGDGREKTALYDTVTALQQSGTTPLQIRRPRCWAGLEAGGQSKRAASWQLISLDAGNRR